MARFEVGPVPFNPTVGALRIPRPPLSRFLNRPTSPSPPSPAPTSWAGSPTGLGHSPTLAGPAPNRALTTLPILHSISPVTTHSQPSPPTKTRPSALSTPLLNLTITILIAPNSIQGGDSMPTTRVLSSPNGEMKKWRHASAKPRKNVPSR
ncbi:UNVERIFIED_CONTAM: hypothetical protein Slati_1997900 [Sesamum latifolium]|uniref:Uncharacterized protein n=1 Tax=Sesamum latifolium TaxID=2727402 RepID=A0AAW2WLT1_9LAMI